MKNKECRSSKYKGITWHEGASKWLSRIKIKGKSLYLGLFDDELDAYAMYNGMVDVVKKNPGISYKKAKRLRDVVSLFMFNEIIVKK